MNTIQKIITDFANYCMIALINEKVIMHFVKDAGLYFQFRICQDYIKQFKIKIVLLVKNLMKLQFLKLKIFRLFNKLQKNKIKLLMIILLYAQLFIHFKLYTFNLICFFY